MKRVSASAMVVAFLVALVWAQAPSQFHPGFNLFSKDQDVQLGQENADEVRKHMTVVRNPYLSEYVTRVGQRLVLAGGSGKRVSLYL